MSSPVRASQTKSESRFGNWLALMLIAAYAAAYMFQVNLIPGERYPNWDAFWVDVRTMGGLYALRDALLHGELPLIDPYTGLGWNLAGNHHSPLGVLNLLVFVLKPAAVMVASQYAVLCVAAAYAFFFLKILSNSMLLSVLGAFLYISAPIVTSRYYYDQTLFGYLFLPLFLFHTHKFLVAQHMPAKAVHAIALALWGLLTVGMADIFFLGLLPLSISIYTFIVAKFHCRHFFFASVALAIALASLALLGGGYYAALVLENMAHNLSAARVFIDQGLLPEVVPYVPGKFGFMFWNYAARSIILPIQGAGAFLYVPLGFYLLIAIGFVRLVRQRHDWEASAIPFVALLLTVLVAYAAIYVFYSRPLYDVFPSIANAATGSVRHLWNVTPFFLTLAMVVVLTWSEPGYRIPFKQVVLVACGAAAVEFVLFFPSVWFISDSLYRISHGSRTHFESANLMPLDFVADPWLLLPLANFLLLLSLGLSANLGASNRTGGSRVTRAGALVLVVVAGLFSASIHNELRLHQGDWQLSTRDDYRMRTYLARKACIEKAVDRSDPDYRTLVTGEPAFGPHGRNWKLIAETELHAADRQRTLFSWREMTHPYTAMSLGLFSGSFERAVRWPPSTDQVEANMDVLDLLSVRWVISADRELVHDRLVKRATCESPSGRMEELGIWKEKEGGAFHVYEAKAPRSLVWPARKVEIVGNSEAVRRVFVDKERPWTNGTVLLDRLPRSHGAWTEPNPDWNDSFTVSAQGYTSLTITGRASYDSILVVGLANRRNWTAYVDGQEAEILNAFGGLMAIPVPTGTHAITLKYHSPWFTVGAFLSGLAVLFPAAWYLLVAWSRRRKVVPRRS